MDNITNIQDELRKSNYELGRQLIEKDNQIKNLLSMVNILGKENKQLEEKLVIYEEFINKFVEDGIDVLNKCYDDE